MKCINILQKFKLVSQNENGQNEINFTLQYTKIRRGTRAIFLYKVWL